MGQQRRINQFWWQAFQAIGAGIVTVAALADPAVDKPAGALPAPLYESDVKPILEAHCVRCHGDERKQAALDLRTLKGILNGGESGPAVVPGKTEASRLYELIHDDEMPPPSAKSQLSHAEKETIRNWIAGGAKAAEVAAGGNVRITFRDVVPVMLRHCSLCHGATRKEAGLDLRTRPAMLKGGKNGPAIEPGHPEKSLMLEKIHSGAMPASEGEYNFQNQPLSRIEIELLTAWIAQGAAESSVGREAAGDSLDLLVTDGDRSFWSFHPPARVSVPVPHNSDSVRNPIDAFLLEKLEHAGLPLAPEAGRLTLLRRAALDLTGLPPDPDEVARFLEDREPDAWERLIDRLLASPRYGERWGRSWLDLAGFADSEGKRNQESSRPHAWRYRDYVIRSLNADKPYDRFLLEQIAGDELADYEHAPVMTGELVDNLVATAFLRMAPDGTDSCSC